MTLGRPGGDGREIGGDGREIDDGREVEQQNVVVIADSPTRSRSPPRAVVPVVPWWQPVPRVCPYCGAVRVGNYLGSAFRGCNQGAMVVMDVARAP